MLSEQNRFDNRETIAGANYETQIIIPFNSRISANHDKVDGLSAN